MSTRITKAMADLMVAKAQELAGIPAARQALAEKQVTNGKAIMVAIAGGQEVWDQLDALQAELETIASKVPKRYRLSPGPKVAEGSYRCPVVTLGDRRVRLRLPRAVGFLWAPVDGYDARLAGPHPLVDEYFDLVKEEKDLDAKVEDIGQAVNAALVAAKFNRKKLLAAWPEAIELLPAEEKAEVTALTVPVANLNALIGLPSGGGQ